MKAKATTVLLLFLVSLGVAQDQITFYGFVRGEAIYDDAGIVKGDWLLFAPSGAGNSADESKAFTMTARHSRIGMKIKGKPDAAGRSIIGLIEADFAGGFPNSSTAARQPQLRLRHAWVEWTQVGAWAFRVGQDWALIASPFPGTTSFVVGAGKGNLWMRYPQMKFSVGAGPVKIAVSANRPMAGNVKYEDYAGGDFDPVGDGEITGLPWFMGRTWFHSGPLTLSVSGHYGKESVADLSGIRRDVDTWSFNGDVVFKSGAVSFTGRFFTGANLNSFFGGIFQGYTRDSTSVTSLPATGGWGQLQTKLGDRVSVTAGGGIDRPDTGNLAPTNRASNDWIFANATYQVSKQLGYVMEWERLTTGYVGPGVADGQVNRLQFEALYKF